jgi:tyrosine-protein kinase Etk/Wzc
MEMQQNIPDSGQSPPFLDWIVIWTKRKRFIICGALIIAIITVVIASILNPLFEATARVIPSQPSNSTQALLSQLGEAAGIDMGSLPSPTPTGPTSDMFNGIINSRTSMDAVIQKYDLVKIWGDARFLGSIRPYTIDHVREKFVTDVLRTEVDGASGIVSIHIDLPDPQLSANMANTFVDELIKAMRKLSREDSAQKKQFFETEVSKDLLALRKAEEALESFQETSGAIQIDDQTKSVLSSITNIEAQIAAQEVQLTVMKTYSTPENPDFRKIQRAVEGLKQQRVKLEESLASDSTIPAGAVPSVSKEYLRKMRDFKYYEALYLIMLKQHETLKQYEAMKHEESLKQDELQYASDVWVIDRAVVPQRRVAPKLFLDFMLGLVFGLFVCTNVAFFQEYLEEASSRNPKTKRSIEEVKFYLWKI